MTFLIQSIGEIMLIAFSMTFLIIAGEIDLSVSSTAALSSCTLGFVWQHSGNIPVAVASGLAVGMVCGAINGLLVTKLGCSRWRSPSEPSRSSAASASRCSATID
jgi:rhamnose transport system permease protein